MNDKTIQETKDYAFKMERKIVKLASSAGGPMDNNRALLEMNNLLQDRIGQGESDRQDLNQVIQNQEFNIGDLQDQIQILNKALDLKVRDLGGGQPSLLMRVGQLE